MTRGVTEKRREDRATMCASLPEMAPTKGGPAVPLTSFGGCQHPDFSLHLHITIALCVPPSLLPKNHIKKSSVGNSLAVQW